MRKQCVPGLSLGGGLGTRLVAGLLLTFIDNDFHWLTLQSADRLNCWNYSIIKLALLCTCTLLLYPIRYHSLPSSADCMKRVCMLVCDLFVLFSLSSDFLILPGFIDFKTEEVVSINPYHDVCLCLVPELARMDGF